jgi:hypothetical protein
MVSLLQPAPQDAKDSAFWERQRAIQRILERGREN